MQYFNVALSDLCSSSLRTSERVLESEPALRYLIIEVLSGFGFDFSTIR